MLVFTGMSRDSRGRCASSEHRFHASNTISIRFQLIDLESCGRVVPMLMETKRRNARVETFERYVSTCTHYTIFETSILDITGT